MKDLTGFAYYERDCDFTTGKCQTCGKEYRHGTRRNCPEKRETPFGPGTQLRLLIKGLGIRYECSACRQMEVMMNRWKVEGCRIPENRAVIVAKLKEGVREASWADWLAAAGGMAKAPWFSILSPLESLVAEAIRRAEAHASPANPS